MSGLELKSRLDGLGENNGIGWMVWEKKVGWFGREGWRVWMGSEGENSVMVWVRRIQGRPDTGFK